MSKPVAGTSAPAAAAAAGKSEQQELHCVRCHETFNVDDKKSKCIVEHDTETFVGSRNGTSWYTGKLGCCGADYRFHRHYSDEKADPEYCFKGKHTTDPNEVKYSNSSIPICTKSGCGEELHAAAKEAYEKQQEAKKRAREAKKASREEEKVSKKAKMEKLRSEGKTREARQLRAEMLGMDPNDPELNSDIDPEGCEEFDCASDSSLVPPWCGSDDGSY